VNTPIKFILFRFSSTALKAEADPTPNNPR